MATRDVQHFYLPLLARHVPLPPGTRVLEMGYYDPAAALWAASQGAHVVALRPSIDLVAELDAERSTPAGGSDDAVDAGDMGTAGSAGALETRLAVRPEPGEARSFDVALLLTPFFLGNAAVRDAIHTAAAALKPDGVLYLQTHRRHGGDTFVRFAGEVFGSVELVDMGGGQRRLYRATSPADVPLEPPETANDAATLHEVTYGGATVRLRLGAGVFASHGIDPGSRLLLATAEVPPAAAILDLGCGAGTLGLALAAADRRARVVLVDSSRPAVDLARENAARNDLRNVDVRIGDGYAAVSGERFHVVVSNLPAHRGHQAESATANRFIAGAPSHLREQGEAWFVANKALPYELPASRAFRAVRLAATDGRYKVLHCTDPRHDPRHATGRR
jgi:16S rRNA (guanine1207-N2)-methyltransferase